MNTTPRAGIGRDTDIIVRVQSISSLLPRIFTLPTLKRGCCIAAAILALPLSNVSAAETAEESSAAPVAEALLEYHETDAAILNWGVTFEPRSKPFATEPDTGSRKVVRGALSLNGAGREDLPCLWDYREAKLYLDLNGNGNLADDGVFTTENGRHSFYVQTFTNVHLRVKTGSGTAPLCIDLHLYNAQAPRIYGMAGCRSLWEGKISLQGRDYQVGRIESGSISMGRANDGHLLLRPWDERETHFELNNGLLDGFGFAERLFFASKAYTVNCELVQQDGTAKYKLAFRDAAPQLAELKITGRSIRRVVMSPPLAEKKQFTVVLDQPKGTVKVPVGDYAHVAVELKDGTRRAYRLQPGSLSIPADAGKTAVLTSGGPLTNSVTVSRRGDDLSLNYQLLGADGQAYALTPQDRSHPPRFVIYRQGTQIHTGNFEFG